MKELYSLNHTKLSMLVCLVLIITSCTSIPVAELEQYKQAFSKVQNVSETILLDYDQVLKKSRSFVRQAQASETEKKPMYAFPETLDSFSRESGTKDENDILLRRQALLVIDRYNQALTQLASNESVQEIQSSTASFGNAVNKFVVDAAGCSFPGAEGVISLATTIAGQIEKARKKKEFETAVKAGEPLIAAILALFIEDANDHYKLTVVLYNQRNTLTIGEIIANVSEIQQLFSSHNAPPADNFTSLEERAQQVNTTLAPLESILQNFEYPFKFESASAAADDPNIPDPPDYTVVIDVEIESRIRAITELKFKYERDRITVMALGAVLKNYQSLLNAAQTSMNTLRKALDKPQNLESSVNELLSLSFEVKRNIEAIRFASSVAY